MENSTRCSEILICWYVSKLKFLVVIISYSFGHSNDMQDCLCQGSSILLHLAWSCSVFIASIFHASSKFWGWTKWLYTYIYIYLLYPSKGWRTLESVLSACCDSPEMACTNLFTLHISIGYQVSGPRMMPIFFDIWY